jgi:fatty acid desaturase
MANPSEAPGDESTQVNDRHRSAKMGLGLVLAFITAVLALAAFLFIWFGVFPSLVVLLLCIPLGFVSHRLIRKNASSIQ